jgi:DNA-binding transcriptional regulator YdaS (Cro superfamily)
MNLLHSPLEALITCRNRAGSDSQMARDLHVSQPRVWQGINRAKLLPAEYVLSAEVLYGVSRHLLRPDIYPARDVTLLASTGELHAPRSWPASRGSVAGGQDVMRIRAQRVRERRLAPMLIYEMSTKLRLNVLQDGLQPEAEPSAIPT